MQLKYRFYFGGNHNPFAKETDVAYARLTDERLAVDPEGNKAPREVFPTLDSWADYLVANSKSVFWQMERAVCKGADKESEIEEFWEEAKRDGRVGEWLKRAEADESEKALCLYMATLHRGFCPEDNTVDFRYYLAPASRVENPNYIEGFSLEAYD